MVGSEDVAARVTRVVAAVRSESRSELRKLEVDLKSVARAVGQGTYERGLVDGFLRVVQAAAVDAGPRRGLAPQSAAFEAGSLPARMLLEIAAGVRGANADLADRLDTDQYQISRAGRRLRDLGLVERARAGRLNGWSITSRGEREVARLRGSP